MINQSDLSAAVDRLTRYRNGESLRSIYAPEHLSPGASHAADADHNIAARFPKDRMLTSIAYLDALPVIASIREDIADLTHRSETIGSLHNQIVAELRAQIAELTIAHIRRTSELESTIELLRCQLNPYESPGINAI